MRSRLPPSPTATPPSSVSASSNTQAPTSGVNASFAYQGGGRGLSLDKLNDLERWVQGRTNGQLLQPNLTILFDLPGEVAQARRSKVRAPDKFEKMDLDFFEKVRQEYLRRAKTDSKRFHIVDATQTPEMIWNGLKNLELNI